MTKRNEVPENGSTKQKPPRLIPGIVIIVLLFILWIIVPEFSPGGTATAISFFGGLGCSLAIIVWWLFFSRVHWYERVISFAIMIASLVLLPLLMHESIKTGLSGMMYYFYAIPVLCMTFVVWVLLSRRLSFPLQIITMALTIFASCGIWALFRSDGITGNASAQFEWRWSDTSEDKLPHRIDLVSTGLAIPESSDITWPGFRGPQRNGIVRNAMINIDWSTNPPVEVWRSPVGPGCSSFAVRGPLLYTQEQRGKNELVSCYMLSTGEPVWQHAGSARFYDSHAGAGPRSTPYLHDTLVIALGATGILNVLKADDGKLIWSKNAAGDIDAKLPGWGYCSSPIVVDQTVIIAISGTLVAYDIKQGALRWIGPNGGENYSSPQLARLDGIDQILMMSGNGTGSFNPADGNLLWEYQWKTGAIVQPAIISDNDILISEGYKKGVHRIKLSHIAGKWDVNKIWTSKKIRPDFNDFTIHKGYLYGFDGLSLTCIDLSDGKRKWRDSRYGGQLLLLAEQDLLLVISEQGEIIIAEANPERFKEIDSFQAIEGKTWNHPVIAKDMLIVRNSNEMAAYRLPVKQI